MSAGGGRGPARESAEASAPGYAGLATPAARRAYFRAQGYLVRPGLVPPALCERVLAAFHAELGPWPGYLYRQASANPERHERTAEGFVRNAILNPVSVDGRHFPGFRAAARALLASDALFGAVAEIHGEAPVLVQSMYFEGNPATWPHQDCYYLDSAREGELLGAWIALEDIAAEAGRFYVVPGSHLRDFGRNAGNLAIARNHERYKAAIRETLEREGLERRAPALRRGDVLLWSSRTIHGALPPRAGCRSRNSLTAHFTPASAGFLQYQCIPVALRPERVNGHLLCAPKDQARLRNRLVMRIEVLLPEAFRRLKRAVIARRIRRLAPRRQAAGSGGRG